MTTQPTTINKREVAGRVKRAWRIADRDVGRASTLSAQNGLRYERRLLRALQATCSAKDFRIEHGAWFAYVDDSGEHVCSTDFIIHTPDRLLVIESKLTYKPTAVHELRKLYLPVVEAATSLQCCGLVIARALTLEADNTVASLSDALALAPVIPSMLWMGQHRIVW